jgi:hypothetical protein
MSQGNRKINIAVLSASVGEHQRQLNFHLQRPLVQFMRKLYEESREAAESGSGSGKHEDLLIFQQQLKLVPKWNQNTLETIIELILGWIRNKHYQITQSIKTVVVARTMLMVAMGNTNGEVSDQVRVDIPDKYRFLHCVISQLAFELYAYPSLLRTTARETEAEKRAKQVSIYSLISDSIENTIIDQLASPAVFEYLDVAMNVDKYSNNRKDDEDNDGDEDEDEDEDGAGAKSDNTGEEDACSNVEKNDSSNKTSETEKQPHFPVEGVQQQVIPPIQVQSTFDDDEQTDSDDESDGEEVNDSSLIRSNAVAASLNVTVDDPGVATVTDFSDARVPNPIGTKETTSDTFDK